MDDAFTRFLRMVLMLGGVVALGALVWNIVNGYDRVITNW